MKKITEKVEKVLTLNNNNVYKQIEDFERTLFELQKLDKIEKPTYTLPQVDTIGKYTFNQFSKS